MRIVAVGAGHAAVQLAASLRQGGFAGDITLIGEEAGLPYQRPPLSKAYLSEEMSEAALALRPAAFFANQRIGLLAGRVVAVDRAAREVRCADGAVLGYDHLVLATGAGARGLDVPGVGLAGVVSLRTRGEAMALRSLLAAARDVVVIGAGFIGMEFAAVAVAAGKTVTVMEAADRALGRGVSALMAAHIAAVQAGWGVRLLFGTGVTAILGEERVEAVQMRDGARIAADLVLVAAGAVPRTELAAAAGLAVADGIVVDALLCTDDPAISAIGDCARFPRGGAMVRLESVQNAVEQARCVAERLLGRPAAYDRVPWFWSDMGKLKLQIAGLSAPGDKAELRGDSAGDGFSVALSREGRVVAVESLNRPGEHMAARRALAG